MKILKKFFGKTISKTKEEYKPYDVIIIDRGNGKWFHGWENPLEHKWLVINNKARCQVCGQIIEKVYK